MPGLALVLAWTALAQPPQTTAPSDADRPVVLDDVEVLARRGRALVDAEVELDGAAIDALGVDDIGEAIRRLAEDYALGETPMIIVNGRRMADPDVFSRFPPDALARLEILPPQAAGLYGADPSRRVMNIVLQRRFHSRDGGAALRRPTAGGQSEASADLSQSSIVDTRTGRLGLKVDVDTPLRAGDRDPSRPAGPDAGPDAGPGARAVTLKPESRFLDLGLARTSEWGDWAVSLNGNGRLQDSRSTALSLGKPIESRFQSRSLTLTGGLNGDLAGWAVQAGLNGGLSESDRSGLSPSGSRATAATTGLGLSRTLLDLPAGPAVLNLSGQATRSRSVTDRPDGRLSRSGHSEAYAASLSLPLLQRPAGDGGPPYHPGDLALALGASLNMADSGRGEGMNAGLTWSPRPRMRIGGAWSTAARSLAEAQRFEPEHYGDPVTVFDFVRGEAVEVLPILGGNPDLRQPRSDRFSVSVSAGPFTRWALQGGLAFQRVREADGVGVLPDPTPEVEAVFPERFRRDGQGRLIHIDQRPVNVAAAVTESLTTSLGAAFPLPASSAGGRSGLLRATVNHSWQLTNATTLREGLPELDRLAGDGGGLPMHQVGLTLDFRQGRWSANAAARWRSGYRSRRDSGRDGPDDLCLDAFRTLNLRLGYQFARNGQARGEGRGRRAAGLQAELEITNLFDVRPGARLGDGRPAPGYGRNDQDPVGRTVLVTLKQRF